MEYIRKNILIGNSWKTNYSKTILFFRMYKNYGHINPPVSADDRSTVIRILLDEMTRKSECRARSGEVDGNCGMPFIRWRTRRIEVRDNVDAFTRFRVSAAISWSPVDSDNPWVRNGRFARFVLIERVCTLTVLHARFANRTRARLVINLILFRGHRR